MPDDLLTIWDAYWTLANSRRVGFSLSYIPFSEIKAYVDLFPVGDVEFFVTCLHALDTVYVDFYLKKAAHGNK